MKYCAILTFAALIAIVLPAHATTHYVDVGGGGDFENIWGAITASVSGDTILVAPGTYTGPNNRNLDPYGKNLVFLAETGGRLPVTIDCEGSGQAFYFHQGEDATTLLSGFTITGAYNSGTGGAITASGTPGASPTIEDCAFLDCRSNIGGGAIAFYGSSSSVSNCVFRGNSAQYRAGAVYASGSSLTIQGCLFDENLTDTDEGGGALYLHSGNDVVEYCTIVENDHDQILIYGSTSDVRIANCVIANGTSGVSVGVNASGGGLVTRCVLFGNPGGDEPECDYLVNIFHDPLFCDDLADDYTLCDDSFAVHYNNMWNEQIGAYESGCEPCATPVEPATWGAVKALFR